MSEQVIYERLTAIEVKLDVLIGNRDDQETRIRSLEQFKWKLMGWAASAGLIAGVVVQLVMRGFGG